MHHIDEELEGLRGRIEEWTALYAEFGSLGRQLAAAEAAAAEPSLGKAGAKATRWSRRRPSAAQDDGAGGAVLSRPTELQAERDRVSAAMQRLGDPRREYALLLENKVELLVAQGSPGVRTIADQIGVLEIRLHSLETAAQAGDAARTDLLAVSDALAVVFSPDVRKMVSTESVLERAFAAADLPDLGVPAASSSAHFSATLMGLGLPPLSWSAAHAHPVSVETWTVLAPAAMQEVGAALSCVRGELVALTNERERLRKAMRSEAERVALPQAV